MTTRIVEIESCLERVLQEKYSHFGATKIDVAGNGLESVVFRVETESFGTIAVRVPWERWISNDNDRELDARDILRKEYLFSSSLHPFGLPVPKPLVLHMADELDFLATAFIVNDQSTYEDEELGQLVAQLHQVPFPETDLFIWTGAQLHDHLSERLVRRTQVVERLTGNNFSLPDEQEIRRMMEWGDSTLRILHMDIRPANLLTYQNKMVGLIDWSNCVCGDPALEIARIAEYGYLSEGFLRGYGSNPFTHIPKVLELLYRLDTATMLAVVFLSEAPDPVLAKQQVARLVELHKQLAKA